MNKKVFLLLAFTLLAIEWVFPQCAICKAVVESNGQAGGDIAKGVNSGILYLMFVPYILFIVIGYLIYKNYKKTKETERSL
jgi:hypothetical protein